MVTWGRLFRRGAPRRGQETRTQACCALEKLLGDGAPEAVLLEALRELAREEGSAGGGVSEAADWLAFLAEKAPLFEVLPEEQATEQLLRWHRVLDYYLWASPQEELDLVALAGHLGSQAAEALARRLGEAQERLRGVLAEKGLERIPAPTGSSFVAGVVEWSELGVEETSDPALHHRVFRLDPGEGGYRASGRILVPSHARRYVCPSEGAP